MARKRTSTSRNPKIETKKPRKVVPTKSTKSTKKSAKNEEKVQLDYLVVEKIASLIELKFAPGLCQELVSSTFANALRSSYSKKKVTLSISVNYSEDDENDADDDSEYPNILLSISRSSQANRRKNSQKKQSKEEIKIDEENLNQAVQQIFTRFRQIHLEEPMFLENIGNEGLACLLSGALNSIRDVTLETLDIAIEYAVIVDCQEFIKKLSRNLQVLNLRIYDTTDQYKSSWKKFCQTVALCTKLVRLSVEFDYSMLAGEDPDHEMDNALLAQIVESIKLLKIKHFRTNLQDGKEKKRTMEWLPRALAKNENLRQLDIDTYFETGCYLGNLVNVKDGPLVLSRLDSLKIMVCDWAEYRKDWMSSFEKILPALSDHAILKPTIQYCKEDIRDILRMYLELSHGTARRIKLRLSFSKGNANVTAVLKKAFRSLSSMKKFRGLKTTPCGTWTRVLFGNANLMVKTIRSKSSI